MCGEYKVAESEKAQVSLNFWNEDIWVSALSVSFQPPWFLLICFSPFLIKYFHSLVLIWFNDKLQSCGVFLYLKYGFVRKVRSLLSVCSWWADQLVRHHYHQALLANIKPSTVCLSWFLGWRLTPVQSFLAFLSCGHYKLCFSNF